MFVEFEMLPQESRIWVYQSERPLTTSEQQVVMEIGRGFIDQWASHGTPLTASIKIFEDYFVVLAVDDRHLPSGCSIDASVGLIRELGNKLDLDLFGRTNVPLWDKNGITMVALSDLKSQIKNGQISQDTALVNTLVQHKRDLAEWIIPLQASWLSRFIPQTQG